MRKRNTCLLGAAPLTVGAMDVVNACRAFVKVSERGSFTVGAAAAQMSQSVASRRVAALEKHFGERLFDRASRRPSLTPFGRDMLPAARRLVRVADVLEDEARAARSRPMRLAVPASCTTAELARLVADSRERDIRLDVRTAGPEQRAELVRTQEVRAGLLAVPPDQALWAVPLGLAGADEPQTRRVFVESLRLRRGEPGPARCIRVQPEDDVPHIQGRLARLRDAVGLRPAQLSVAPDLTSATADVLSSDDLLLCSSAQAAELGLHWRPVGELRLARGYVLDAAVEADAERLRGRLAPYLARALGATAGPEPEPEPDPDPATGAEPGARAEPGAPEEGAQAC